MKPFFLAPICILLALPAPALAQTTTERPTVERQVKGKPEANINAGIFATIKNDCTAGPLPAVRLLNPPAHGKVIVKQGRLRATNFKQCLGLDVPAFVAIYRSARGFVGQDAFTLEVTGTNGKPQLQRITVTVGPGVEQKI